MSLDDVEGLLDSWGQSYSYLPPEVKEKVGEAASKITKGYFADVMGQFLKHRLATDNNVIATSSKAVSLAFQRGFIRFAIGVEGSLGNINNDDVPYYLSACNLPFNIYLVGFLDALEERKKPKPKRADKMVLRPGSYLTETAVFLANQGFLYRQSVKPKYGEGELSLPAADLLNIDIDELRRG